MKAIPISETIAEEPDASLVVSPAVEESQWYIPKATREEAEKLLSGREPGTFLVRRRAEGVTGQTHALSVVV